MLAASPYHASNQTLWERLQQPCLSCSFMEKVFTIFRQIGMTFHYELTKACYAIKRLFSWEGPFPSECLKYSCQNLATREVFRQCLRATAPLVCDKNLYHFGKSHGLRVTAPVILRPSGGLCFGMAIDFVSRYLSSDKSIDLAAQAMQKGASNQAVAMQALSDTLLSYGMSPDKNHLHTFINQFENRLSRKEVLQKQEEKSPYIAPAVYAAILEAYAQVSQGPLPLAASITKSIGELVGLHVEEVNMSDQGIVKALSDLPNGAYLIKIPDHIIAFIRSKEGTIAFFDANAGTAIAKADDAEKLILQTLHYHAASFTNTLIMSVSTH